MKRNSFWGHFAIAFSALLLPIMLFSFVFPLHDASAVYGGVIRLHILAASDEEDEQAVKLKVRDAILDEMGALLNSNKSREEAEREMSARLDEIQRIAKKVLKEEGKDHAVKVTLEKEYYPTREYESIRLPAGEYLSLRVIIGEGEGKNWWCMVYPPLCTSSAEAGEALSEAGFTPSQVRLLTEKEDKEYVVRFKVVESVSSAVKKLKKWFS